MNYIDLYVLPVPIERLDEYKEQASTFGTVVQECGGLSYREFKADDMSDEHNSLLKTVTVQEGEVLTAAVAEFDSRAHRDEVMAKVMADPRIQAMEHEEIADMSRMFYGGLVKFVDPS